MTFGKALQPNCVAHCIWGVVKFALTTTADCKGSTIEMQRGKSSRNASFLHYVVVWMGPSSLWNAERAAISMQSSAKCIHIQCSEHCLNHSKFFSWHLRSQKFTCLRRNSKVPNLWSPGLWFPLSHTIISHREGVSYFHTYLNLRYTTFRCLMRPVPVVLRLLALALQLSKEDSSWFRENWSHS